MRADTWSPKSTTAVIWRLILGQQCCSVESRRFSNSVCFIKTENTLNWGKSSFLYLADSFQLHKSCTKQRNFIQSTVWWIFCLLDEGQLNSCRVKHAWDQKNWNISLENTLISTKKRNLTINIHLYSLQKRWETVLESFRDKAQAKIENRWQ